MKRKKDEVSIEERVLNEKEAYRKQIDRKKYNAAFGHAQAGYPVNRRDAIYASVLKKGKDKKVLEIGSTSWRKFIDFENYPPKELICINISEVELEKGRKRASNLNTSAHCNHTFQIMDAHKLEFPDNTFDICFGQEILHHLDYEAATKEIARVLKPGGEMIFIEPLGRNPIGKLVRWLTPTKRTDFEKPVSKKEVEIFKKYFKIDLFYSQLFYVPAGAISKYLFKSPKNPFTYIAHKLDLGLEKIFRGFIGLYYRQIIIKGTVKK